MSASVRRVASPALGAPLQACILRRSGGRPLRFEGLLLACCDEACAPVWLRLRLALYQRADGGYVCEMQGVPNQFRPEGSPAGPAWCHAAAAESLEAALVEFETMAARDSDTVPTAAPADPAAALFEAAARLWRETARTRALRHEVGRFLFRICIELADG